MTRKPLVLIGGDMAELPASDVLSTEQFFSTSGAITTGIKKWIGSIIPTVAINQSIDISSAGFTSILDVQVIAMRDTADPMLVPNVSIKSRTTSAIAVNITQPNNATVAILGINVLSGGPSIAATPLTNITLFVEVTGI